MKASKAVCRLLSALIWLAVVTVVSAQKHSAGTFLKGAFNKVADSVKHKFSPGPYRPVPVPRGRWRAQRTPAFAGSMLNHKQIAYSAHDPTVSCMPHSTDLRKCYKTYKADDLDASYAEHVQMRQEKRKRRITGTII